VGQIVEIPFRGNGWVYMGEIASRRGIVYNPRRNDSEGQVFVFTLEEAGTYVLRFYRNDFIRDYILNDHVQIIAEEAPTAGVSWFNPPVDRGRVVAQPRWPSAVEETQIRNGTRPASEPVVTSGISNEPAKEAAPAQSTAPQQRIPAPETNANRTPTNPSAASSAVSGQAITSGQPASAGQTAVTAPPSQTTAVVQSEGENLSVEKQEKLAPEIIMQKARENYDGGNISAAIALLDQFMVDYPGGSDEAYWQLGQCYEANSPSRNILLSLDYYRRLVNEYPQSTRFNDARRRIAYLERYYINIQ
jgi:TolA-binding protein